MNLIWFERGKNETQINDLSCFQCHCVPGCRGIRVDTGRRCGRPAGAHAGHPARARWRCEAPTRCLNCHAGYNTAVEPGFNWKGSMMAQAARDFLFWSCLTVAAQDSIWAVGQAQCHRHLRALPLPQGLARGPLRSHQCLADDRAPTSTACSATSATACSTRSSRPPTPARARAATGWATGTRPTPAARPRSRPPTPPTPKT